MFAELRNILLSAVYPQKCTLCDGMTEDMTNGCVCSECWAKTKFFTGLETLCLKCGAFLSEAEPLFDTYCHACDDAKFDSAIAFGPYRDGIMASIIYLKTTPYLPKKLITQAVFLYNDRFADIDPLLIPVPLSARRRAERGFNQAEVIAVGISKECGAKVDNNSLVRVAHTHSHRAAMDRKAREISVKNAFDVKRKNLIRGKDILLIDDVMTSGATASACAYSLKKAGAASVNVMTLGRAVLGN